MAEALIDARAVVVAYAARRQFLSKTAPARPVLHGVDLTIGRGETVGIVGESGSGKTTLGRALIGLLRPVSGSIHVDGREITDLTEAAMRPLRRRMQMIFQDPMSSLNPRRTIGRTLTAPLLLHGLVDEHAAARRRVEKILERVGLPANVLERYPHELSGGQRQRVALARSLVKHPRVLLLDEPMAALDKKLRGETQFELMALQRQLGLTFIIVTHDQSEAMTVADRIAVMDRGRLMQVAPPAEIYEHPNSRWVADFIGTVNLFEGRVGDAEGTVEGTALGRLQVNAKIDAEPHATVWVAVRPEKIRLSQRPAGSGEAPGPNNSIAATVVDVGYLGDLSIYKLQTEAGVPLRAAIANTGSLTARGIGWADKVWVSFAPEAAIVLTR